MISIPKYSTYVFPGSPVANDLFTDSGTGFVFKYNAVVTIWELQVHGFYPTTLVSNGIVEYVPPQDDDEFSVHADSTPVAPGTPAANHSRVYIESTYAWQDVLDYRTTDAWLQSNGTKVTFTLGMDFNDTTMTIVEPPVDYSNGYYVYNPTTDVWDYDLATTRLFQKRKISKDASANLEAVLTPGLDSVYDLMAWAFARQDAYNYDATPPGTDLPFYTGVMSETSATLSATHTDWDGPSGGAGQYFGVFAARKKTTVDAIDAATTGPDILAVTWTPF
jgi:hypothetical protein